jgi:hypothetical protein
LTEIDARATALILAILGMAAIACPARESPSREEDFLRLKPRERVEALSSLDHSRQIELYLYVVNHSHPPDYRLSEYLGSQGGAILPALLAKLRENIDDEDTYALFLILDSMAPRYYDLRADTATASALRRILDERPTSSSICYSERILLRVTGSQAHTAIPCS